MMKRSGSADLPLHYGYVPKWLCRTYGETWACHYRSHHCGIWQAEMLRRLSDPFWFQSLGAVMGMDWHSSGITTSVMGALKTSDQSTFKRTGHLYLRRQRKIFKRNACRIIKDCS